jgi:DNA-binding transcriptional regulator YdaS (Cro superfamily)
VNRGLKLAIEKAGGYRALARKLGIRYQSIQCWEQIPAERVIAIEKITGLRRETLRPDIYPPEK